MLEHHRRFRLMSRSRIREVCSRQAGALPKLPPIGSPQLRKQTLIEPITPPLRRHRRKHRPCPQQTVSTQHPVSWTISRKSSSSSKNTVRPITHWIRIGARTTNIVSVARCYRRARRNLSNLRPLTGILCRRWQKSWAKWRPGATIFAVSPMRLQSAMATLEGIEARPIRFRSRRIDRLRIPSSTHNGFAKHISAGFNSKLKFGVAGPVCVQSCGALREALG